MNNYQSQIKDILTKILYFVIAFGLIAILFSAIFAGFNYMTILGAVVGSALAFFNQFFYIKTIVAIYDKQTKSDSFLKKSYIIRYLMLFVILGVCSYFLKLNPLAMLFPLIGPKLCYYLIGAGVIKITSEENNTKLTDIIAEENSVSDIAGQALTQEKSLNNEESNSFIIYKDENGKEIKEYL